MLIKTIKTESLETEVYDTRVSMGLAAGAAAAKAIYGILATKPFANVIFAAAPSQNEMLEALKAQNVDFSRINAFHMDEYVGLSIDNEQSFARYLTEHIFSSVGFASVNLIPATLDADDACARYTALLEEYPPDVVCMGIGENGHIAFNDPPVADFADPKKIKRVALDDICRMQQVHDGCFASIDEVPTHALTLTVPTLANAPHLVCTVPAPTKRNAVKLTVLGPVTEDVPATVMRGHDDCVKFCDADSGADLL